MCVAVFAGCGGSQQPSSQPSASQPSASGAQPSGAQPSTPGAQPSASQPEQNKEKIKIGFLTSLGGPTALSGRDMRDAFLLYLKQNNNMLGGHEIELIIEEDNSDAGTAVQKARKFVEVDEVDLIVGPIRSPSAAAMVEYTNAEGVPVVLPIPSTDPLTQHNFNPLILRSGYASSQIMFPMADYAYNVLGYRTVASLALDNAFGYEAIAGFQYEFERLGGTVTAKIWFPDATKDFAPYISQISQDVEALVSCASGANSLNMFIALEEYGIKLPVIGAGTNTEESQLEAIGDAANGSITSHFWSTALDIPSCRAFVSAYNAEYGRDPGYFANGGYDAAIILDWVFGLMPGAFDKELLLNEWKNFEGMFARGPVKMDEYNNPIMNIYIRRTENVNGKVQNTVIYTYEAVSQFYVYGAEAVLARPIFTKDFPPLRN